MLNSSVPEEDTLISSHVLFSSPASKQPLLPGIGLGLVCGLEIVEVVVNSSMFPNPEGVTLKDGFVQASVELVQSPH